MSELKKSRLEVQAILKSCIEDGLAFMQRTGWAVMEFANASFQRADRVVLMNLIGSRRVGWQGRSHSLQDGGLVAKEEWIEEQRWQIHCVCKRGQSASPNDEYPEDACSDLVTWFNGMGCDKLRAHGMANLRIDSDSIFVYTDNSDLYQKRAVFTVKIQVPKEVTTGQDAVDAIIPDVEPI